MTDERRRNGSTPMSTIRVNGAGGVVRVDRGEHEVTGERRVDRDLDRLLVADLADHDDVGILAEEGAERAREREPDLRLTCTWWMPPISYSTGSSAVRMLMFGLVDPVEARVERGRLAGAGRAGDEDDAVGPLDQRVHQRVVARGRSRGRAGRAGRSTC